MIWLALLIPVFAIVILALKFPKRMNIVEYAVVFLVPIICIVVGKWSSVHTQTRDTEYWNSYGTMAVHEEEWKEKWTELETYTTTDSKGNIQTHTRTVTRYKTNPEKWTLFDNIKGSFSISKSYFEQLCNIWGNRTFKDMERHKTAHTITQDGNAYVTKYDNVFDHTIPLCKQYTYENKVQCSKSVFNFEEVSNESKSKYKLFDYPSENIFNFNPILGYKSPIATLRLQYYNALSGSKRQLHMMLLVFQGQPLEAGLFQRSYWKGGNKNEFIVCIGLKGKEIKWTRVISWTEQEELKVKTAREIKEMKEFDPVQVVDYMGENIPKKFVRKKFVDFSYIAVHPTTTAIMITYGITLLVTLGISLLVIFNRYDFGTFLHRNKNSYRSGCWR